MVRARTYRRASLCVGTGSGDEGRRAGAGVTLARRNRDFLMTKLTTSDLRAEAQKLIRTGKMPSLTDLVEAIREVKQNPKHEAPFIQDVLVRKEGKNQCRLRI
jgi:hypothetical protein